jgi:hypothetical protein
MRRADRSRRMRLLLIALFLVMLAGLTLQAARSLAAALERTVTYTYFDEALASVPDVLAAVDWRVPSAPLNRAVADSDKAVLGKHLTEAWSAHASALATGNAAYLPDHFSGVALERAQHSVAGDGARMVVLHQTVRPSFFHRDGSLVQLESQALTVRFLLNEGELAAFRLTEDTNVTTLMNEAKGWRIFSHERRDAQDVSTAGVRYPRDARLAGINYYPAESPWRGFWPGFDRATVAADMALVRGLGANAVRIFLQRDAFLDPKVAAGNLENLGILLTEAQAAGLQVVPTLFDMRGGYEPGRWANDFLWLEAVLPVLQAASNVAYVDLKNQPDLDFALHGRGTVEAWLMTMTAAIRQIAPELPVTVGWSNASMAPIMSDLLDLVTFHDYQPLNGAATRLADLRLKVGDKPVHVTEIGASSWSLAFGLLPHSPLGQSNLITARARALADAEGLFVWTLHDFPDPDPVAIGHSPWRRGLQANFGLIAADGTEKPAAAAAREAFAYILKGPSP